jgi:peptide/nickel transport system substrate-binding protein
VFWTRHGAAWLRKRILGIRAASIVVAGACGSSTTQPPATTNPPTGLLSPSAGSSGSTLPAAPDLTGTTYEPALARNQGGKVTLAEWQYPDTVNPYYAMFETDIEVSGSLFSNLVDVTPDLKYVPDLATNIPTLANGDVSLKGGGMDVTWKLHAGMQWSDSSPINCDDIKATWLWMLNKDNSGLAEGTVGWQDVTGVDGGGGTTCVMHFARIYEGYLTLVSPLLPARYLTVIPVKSAKTKLYPMTDLVHGVYSGPYIPASVTPHASITLKPNPYWQTISGHAPWLSSVVWKYYGDVNTMIDGYSNGEYDLGQDLDNTNDPALAAIPVDQVVAHDSSTYEQLTFNNASFQTKFGRDADPIIAAIKLATDRQAIAKLPLVGNVSVTNNFVPAQAWYYKAVGGPNGTGGIAPADPTTAYTILANAGWTRGPDGYLAKDGKTLELSYCTTTRQFRVDTLNLMAAQMQQIGIKVDVTENQSLFMLWNAPQSDTPCNLSHGNFDVAEFSYVSRFDPLGGYRIYHSTQIPSQTTPGGENFSRIKIAALDSAYDTIAGSADYTTVAQAMYSIQDLYGSDQNTYQLPLYFRKDIWLVSPKLHNFTGNQTASGAEWNIGDWWVG